MLSANQLTRLLVQVGSQASLWQLAQRASVAAASSRTVPQRAQAWGPAVAAWALALIEPLGPDGQAGQDGVILEKVYAELAGGLNVGPAHLAQVLHLLLPQLPEQLLEGQLLGVEALLMNHTFFHQQHGPAFQPVGEASGTTR